MNANYEHTAWFKFSKMLTMEILKILHPSLSWILLVSMLVLVNFVLYPSIVWNTNMLATENAEKTIKDQMILVLQNWLFVRYANPCTVVFSQKSFKFLLIPFMLWLKPNWAKVHLEQLKEGEWKVKNSSSDFIL